MAGLLPAAVSLSRRPAPQNRKGVHASGRASAVVAWRRLRIRSQLTLPCCLRPLPSPPNKQCLAAGAYVAAIMRGRGSGQAIAARRPLVAQLRKFAKVAEGMNRLPKPAKGDPLLSWWAC